MQTEEETAAAEEPILEEGSGREQVGSWFTFVYFRLVCVFTGATPAPLLHQDMELLFI